MLFSIILIVTLVLLDSFWNSWLKKQTSEKQIWILNIENKTFDFAFIGSSRVYTCIDPYTISKKTLKSTINLGSDGASLMENFIILKQFLKAGNKIKTVYLQLDGSALINMNKAYSYPFHDYLFLNKLNTDEVKDAVIKTKGDLKYYFWRFIPYMKYAEFNNFYNPKIILPFFNHTNDVVDFDKTLGSNLVDIQMPDSIFEAINNSVFIQDDFVVDSTSISYLNKIINTCKKNNIKCVLFKVPLFKNAYVKFASTHKAEECINRLSIKNNCRFIDFQKIELAANKDCFKDCSHLNKHGALLFSSILADSLLN